MLFCSAGEGIEGMQSIPIATTSKTACHRPKTSSTITPKSRGSARWCLFRGAVPPDEITRMLGELQPQVKGSREAFSVVQCSWITQRLLSIAKAAEIAGSWGTVGDQSIELTAVDPLLFDRFGPAFSTPEFKWHCDGSSGDGVRNANASLRAVPPAT